jgi:hypothetical protein
LVLHCAVFETPADHILEAVELVKDRKSSGPCFRRASVKRLRSERGSTRLAHWRRNGSVKPVRSLRRSDAELRSVDLEALP